jgi:hypothetical protein
MTDQNTALAVIDATLAGDPVGPEHADLAELALILTGERPAPEAAFAARLDQQVERRFVREAPPGSSGRPRFRWLFAPGGALAVAGVLALIVVLSGGGSSGPAPVRELKAISAAASGTSSTAGTPSRVPPVNFGANAHSPGAANGSFSPAPSPSSAARKVIQSSQLSLSARPNQVDNVAQQVFNVVAAQNGYVNSSSVTATGHSDGYAQFALTVPSSNLSPTLAALSRLRGARVVSRTDATQDVTGQLGGDGRRLAEARALRTALLRQLAAATTSTAIASLKTQIHDVDGSINNDLATLRRLQRQVAYSQIALTLNANLVAVHPGTSGGFTLGRAVHDAGRVLVVAAGVALIVLAALVPVGLLVALGLWVGALVRRRRREQALDAI